MSDSVGSITLLVVEVADGLGMVGSVGYDECFCEKD